MQHFTCRDGQRIAYYQWGDLRTQPVVVLHHGFASNAHANWVATGVVAALCAAQRSVLAVDALGHGASDQPCDPIHYGEHRMASDLLELLARLGLDQVDLVGYSMGAVVSLLAALQQRRFRRMVIAGVGEGVIECGGVDTRLVSRQSIIDALLEPQAADIAHPGAAAFRLYADRTGANRAALAAQAARLHDQPLRLDLIAMPVLVVAGQEDALAAHPERLTMAIPGAQCHTVPGDHLGAVRRPEFSQAIIRFLTR